MADNYLPPENVRIPFNFTEGGYEAPGATSVLMNFTSQGSFGTLQAAINVTQPYWETTHTYPKFCPKYVVGYGSGGVQIIKGRCIFGGIRDLQGIITGIAYTQVVTDLGGIINGIMPYGYSDLSAQMRITRPSDLAAEVGIHQPKDLPASLDGIKFKGSGDLYSFLEGHTPRDLQAYLGTHAPGDMPADIFGDIYHGESNLGGTIDKHLPEDLPASVGGHQAGNLGILLKGWKYGAVRNLPGLVHGWQESPDLNAEIDTHDPRNLGVRMRGWAREVPFDLPALLVGLQTSDLQGIVDTHLPSDVRASIRAWHRGIIGDLPAVIRMWQQEDLPATIGTHIWVNLTAKVLPHPPPPIMATIRGWVREATRNLGAPIHGWQDLNLPAYMSGFHPGNLGIILRAWSYETPQDFPALIHGWQEGDLGIITKGGHSPRDFGIIMKGVGSGIIDLPASLHGWQELDLGVVTKGGHLPGNMQGLIRIYQHENFDLTANIYGWQEISISADISLHQPKDIWALIKGVGKSYGDLHGMTRGYDIIDLSAAVGTHPPVLLNALIKPGVKTIRDVQGAIHGWEWRLLGMTLAGTHYPIDLGGYLNPTEKMERDILASVYGWAAKDLSASFRMVYPADLPALLLPVRPFDLPAYLKARYYSSLYARIHSYDIRYLGAYIKRIYREFLPARINPVTDIFRNLGVIIDIHGESYSNLTAYIRAYQWKTLSASLVVKYLGNLSTYIYAIPPRNLKGIIHGWEERFLQGILTVAAYPWNLTAFIYPRGTFRDLSAFIKPIRFPYQQGNLGVNVHPWEVRDFPAHIYAARTGNLWASVYMYHIDPITGRKVHTNAKNLPSSIYPKMIRLTTIVKIPTLVARDLSAIINYPCFRTGYSNLRSSIWAKFKGDLYAFIRGYIPANRETNLGAKIGYSDSYVVTDNYKITLDLLPSKYYTEDIYKLRLSILSQKEILGAYIRPTPRFRGMPASIIGDDIPTFAFPELFKNREKVIHKTYDGQFETFEIVEMAFKSAVKEYYYSAVGNIAWPANRFEKWMLDVRSMLPVNLSLRLKRRLHRATTVYNFARFNSVDDAIRYAIAHVTEWPEGNLGASIYNRSKYEQLKACIVPRYIHHEQVTMAAYINPLKESIIISEPENISKIN